MKADDNNSAVICCAHTSAEDHLSPAVESLAGRPGFSLLPTIIPAVSERP